MNIHTVRLVIEVSKNNALIALVFCAIKNSQEQKFR